MKLYFIFFIIIFFSVSCNYKKSGIDDNIVASIPPDILINIIYDIHIADAMMVFKKDILNKVNSDSLVYNSIFLKYNYSREEFENTLLYYTHYNIDSLNLFFSQVVDSLHKTKAATL